MSTHLLVATAYLQTFPPAAKLVLMAIADSADEHTLLSAPGLPKLRAWSGLSRSQVLRVLADLKTDTYAGLKWVEQTEAGRQGRRATFRVFPAGVPAIPHPDEVRARFEEDPAGSHPCDPETPVDNDQVVHIEGRTDATLNHDSRVAFPENRVAPMRPLQSSTSVSMAPTPETHTPAAVESAPAAPSRPTTPRQAKRPVSGFPGARTTAPADGPTLSAKDIPCPRHPGHPAGRCAPCVSAAVLDEDAKAARAAVVKAAIKPRRKGSNPTKTLHDLEAARRLADETTTEGEEATG